MRSDVRWRLCWENELRLADHVELSDFLRKTYTEAVDVKPFEGGQSWAGVRPEFRAIGYDSNGIAAHICMLRRFIKVGEVDLLVAEVGLYGVRQDLEGISLSMSAVYPVLQQLGVPFAFGTIQPAMRNHVERFCRDGRATILSGVRVRSTSPGVYLDLPPTRVEDVLVFVVPIGRSMSEWPSGTLIDRNGSEL
ncbi:NodA family N-acyltransferase [Mesorhizobium tamadayense]|uniref:NodA family N-acyltransferase n=1 Tax=Mesorhizobium tamadayense TaxID=425306 RepID=A0A3P3F0B1_9HYPH|nr:NodA family N-acyltransferase [Mesorhizobium tamadayense]RRH91917.1 NodA family N-acyltransferase [Mesorhizobium tamadayense]